MFPCPFTEAPRQPVLVKAFLQVRQNLSFRTYTMGWILSGRLIFLATAILYSWLGGVPRASLIVFLSRSWDEKKVIDWLHSIRCGQYEPLFKGISLIGPLLFPVLEESAADA